ncbi:hypothetical protein [Nocardioides sp. L-11A]|uniref:hypothetical protein n=1 Tax=Nocardioides sp. L-11A TaxID=3043848 RepID=UPI00249A3AFE|nr:hypothetical protein QJ852_07965 [Nocardioides sp. L-11A]
MADLQIDSRLQDLYTDLRVVSCNFKDADYSSRVAADAVGHDLLAGKVRDFATKWDDRRPKIIAALDTLWQSAQAIDENFRGLDDKMASQMAQGS